MTAICMKIINRQLADSSNLHNANKFAGNNRRPVFDRTAINMPTMTIPVARISVINVGSPPMSVPNDFQ